MRERIIRQGDTQIAASKIVLGTGGFGTGIREEEAFAQMDAYYAAGGRTLDTARVYGSWAEGGDGASETCVGRWIKSRGVRGQIVISTKGAHPPLSDIHKSRMTAENIERDLNESLAFLQTDHVEIYFLHRDDVAKPVSYIVDALDTHVKAGKIRLLGASNWTRERIAEANAYALANGKAPFSVSQIEWSCAAYCAKSHPDDTLVSMHLDEYAKYQADPMPVMAFSSQAHGFFTKLDRGEDALRPQWLKDIYLNPENRVKLDKLRRLAAEKGATIAQIALADITCDPLDGMAIIGASNPSQLTESLESERFTLSPDEIAYIAAV